MKLVVRCLFCNSGMEFIVDRQEESLRCSNCTKEYKIRKGVPILLAKEEEEYREIESEYRKGWKQLKLIRRSTKKNIEYKEIIEPVTDWETNRKTQWTLWNTLWSVQYDEKIIRWLLRYMKTNFAPGRSLRVLNVGSGTGTYDFAVLRHFPEAEIIGIDLVPGGVIGTQSFAITGRMQYICADALDLPFFNDYFDFIYSKNVIEHAGIEFLNEIKRVLKPQGRTFILGPSHESYYFIRWRPYLKTIVQGQKFQSHGVPTYRMVSYFNRIGLSIEKHKACTFRFFQRKRWFKELPPLLMRTGFIMHKLLELIVRILGLTKYLHIQIIQAKKGE